MLIIHENELIHTDDFNDVIEHFGIKGMKWGIRSRHKDLKDTYADYKEASRHADNLFPAALNPNHPHYKLARATMHEAAAMESLYKSKMYSYLHKEKAEKAKQRGKKVKDKVTKKLKKKNDINYQNYVGHHSLAGKYFDAYRNQ